MLKKTALNVKPSPEQVLKGLEILVNAFKENHRVTEEEGRNRTNIKAMRDIEIERIKAQKETIKLYFDHVFSERKVMIDGMFEALDKGIALNDATLIGQSMGAIVTIAQESPLKNMQNLLSDFNNESVDSITI